MNGTYARLLAAVLIISAFGYQASAAEPPTGSAKPVSQPAISTESSTRETPPPTKHWSEDFQEFVRAWKAQEYIDSDKGVAWVVTVESVSADGSDMYFREAKGLPFEMNAMIAKDSAETAKGLKPGDVVLIRGKFGYVVRGNGVTLWPIVECTVSKQTVAKANEAASAPPTVTPTGQEADQATLVRALVSKGDEALAAGRKGSAKCAYMFATQYAPSDEGIRAKWSGVDLGPPSVLDDQTYNRVVKVITQSNWPKELYEKCPPPTPKMDLVELRILLDEKVVGDWRYHAAEGRFGTTTFFLAKPSVSFADMEKTYGPPSSQAKIGDVIIWTYGRFRMVGSGAGKIDTVHIGLR